MILSLQSKIEQHFFCTFEYPLIALSFLKATDDTGLPVAVSVGSAASHEVTIFESTLDSRFITEFPERQNGDRAYDRDPLNQCIAEQDVDMTKPPKWAIAAHHKLKIAVHCVAIAIAGWSNYCLPGCKTSVA